MNHIYKSIFNKALGVFTAVPEFASAHGKGSERTVVGRVAKGTAGFAASALAISVGLALTSTNAVAAGAPGIYVNNSNDPACMAFIDDIHVAPAQIIYGGSKQVILPDGFTPGTALSPDTGFNLAGRNPCVAVGGTAAENHDTQTNRTLFYNDKNLTLGGRLDVNSGIIGVGDRGTNGAGATNSIRMGTGTTLADANKVLNGIAIGVNTQATQNWATAIGADAVASGNSAAQALGYDAVASGKSAIAQGFHSHANGQSAVAIGDNTKASGIGQVAIGYASNAQKADIDKAAIAAPNKADYAVTIGHYAGADYTGTNNYRSTLVGDNAGRYGEEGVQNTAVGSLAGMYVKGSNNVAMGTNAGSGTAAEKLEVSGTTAIGNTAKALTNDSVAIGTEAKSGKADKFSGERSVAIGAKAEALGTGGIAIGDNAATTDGHNGVAIGVYSKTQNEKAISIGAFNKATGAQSIVIAGNYDLKNSDGVSVASGTRATVIGAETTVSGNNSVAIGDKNTVASHRTYAIGNNINVATGADDSLAFGTKAGVGGANAIALGNTAKATKENTIAQGTESVVYGKNSVSIGYKAVSGIETPTPTQTNAFSVSIGNETEAIDASTIAIGDKAKAKGGVDALAVGTQANAMTYKALAIGAYSQATGRQSTVIGNDIQGQPSIASGTRSQILGVQSNVSGDNSVSIGDTNTVASNRTYAIGNNINIAEAAVDSLAFGTKAGVKSARSIAIGTEASAGSTDTTYNPLGDIRATAIGSEAKASGLRTVALGDVAVASERYGTALGSSSNVSAAYGTAVGFENRVSGEGGFAAGTHSVAAGRQQISIGHFAGDNVANSGVPAKVADYGVFIGRYAGSDAAGATGNTSGVAIGMEAGRYGQGGTRNTAIGEQAGQYVKGSHNIAMGTNAGSGTNAEKLEVSNTAAIGNAAKALTDDSISIGRDSKAGKVDKFDGKKSIAIGYASEAMGSNAIALGSNAATNNGHDSIAMGTYAKTNGEKTISIGAYNTAEGAQSIVIAGNYDASTGSNRSTTTAAAKRAIVVGPESHATAEDAVAIGNKNTVASARTYALGNNINVAAGADDSLAFGTKAAVGAENTVAIGANANAAQANSVALGAGSATSAPHTGDYTLNNSYTAAGLPNAANGTVSVGAAGKERQIQNVAAGVISATSTDAINGSQLYATNNYLSNLATGVQNVLGGDAAVDNAGSLTMSNIGGTGKGNVNDAIAVANTKVAAGENITVTPTTNADGSKTYTVATTKDLVVDSVKAGDTTVNTDGVTIANGPSVKKDGINAGDKKITGVADGNVAAGSKDAVNGGQLAEVKAKADSAVQDVVSSNPTALTANKVGNTVTLTPNFIAGDLVNADGTVNAPAAADEGKLVSAKTVADALKANHFVVDTKANGGTVDASVSEENAKVGSGNKVTFEAGKNLVAQQTNTANGGATVNYKLSDTLENLVSVKSAEIEAGIGPNKVVLNNNGVKVGDSTLNDKGLTINNGPSVTDTGIDAGNKKITGVADGNVAAGSTDAVNGGQLAAVKAKADSAVQDIKSGDEKALSVTKAGNTYTITPNLSGDLVDANGNITAPTTPADKGKLVTAGTVAEALANTHFVVDTKATDGELDAASQADQKIKASNKVTLQAGKNLKAKQTNGANGAEVEFSLKDSISLKEVKVGEGSANEVVLNNNGVNVAGNTYINKDGLNANDKKITNVASGAVTAASKDAVNGSQLYNVANNVKDLIGPDAAIDPATGKVTVADPAKGIGETGKGNIGDAIKHVNDAAKAAAETAAKHTTVVEGKNVKVTKGKNAAGGDEYTVATKDDLDVTSVTAGNTTVNTNGLTITGGPSVTRGGIDAGNRVISGVKAGDVSATSQEAVNGSQLHATNTKLDGVKAKADTAVQDVKSGDENALTAVKDPNTNIVTVTPKLSGDLVDANGNITAPTTPADKGKLVTAGTVADALANTHFVVDTKATDGELDASSQADQKIKAGNKVTLQAGKNLKAKQTNGANGAQVEFSLKDSISLTQVTAGDSTLNTDGLTIAGGPSVKKDGINAGDKTITNVAPGAVTAASKDAVNGGQLYNVANNVKDLIGPDAAIDPATGKVTVADPAKGIGETGKGTIGEAIKSVKDKADTAVQDIKSGDDKALSVTKAGNTYTITPNLSGDLVDANGNITAPTTPADKGKLVTAGTVADALANTHFVVDTKATDGELDAASQADQKIKASNKVTLQAGKNLKAKQTNGTDGAQVEFSLKDSISLKEVTAGEGANQVVLGNDGVKVGGNTYINNAGLNANGNKITNVADGVDPTDAVNKGQLDAVKAVADSAVKSVDVANGEQNLVVDNSDPKNPKLSLKKDLTVDSVKAGDSTLNTDGLTIAGGPSVKKDGINAGDKTITNVAPGAVTPTSKDAVNGGQLYNVANNVKDLIGPDATIDPATGKVAVADPTKGIGETGKDNIGDAIKHVNDAAKAAADTAKKHTTVEKGDNIVVEESTNADGGKHYKVSTAKDLNVDSVKAGDTTVNNDGVTIAGGPSVTKGGINAGGNTITNVADGVNPNDAVNKGQLDAVKGVADSAVKSVDVANGEQNLVVDNSDPKNPKLSLKKDLTVDSVKAGDSTLNNDGLTIAGGPSVKKDGIDAGDKKITNVAAGDVAENSKDAVNGGQLHSVASSVATVLGGNAAVDGNGNVTMSNIGGTGKGNVDDAIAAVKDAADKAADTAKKHTTVEQGDNIVVEESTNADGGKHYKVSTARDLNVDSVKAGDTTVNNDGVTIAGGPSVTKGGINAGGNTITNVADGVNDTDAVNKGQLNKVDTKVSNVAQNVVNVLGGDAAVNGNGDITMSNIGETGQGNINDAIKSVNDLAKKAAAEKTSVKAKEGRSNVTVTEGVNAAGGHEYTVDVERSVTNAGSDYVTVTNNHDADTNTTTYTVDVSAKTKASLAKADSAVQGLTSKDGNLNFTKGANGNVEVSFNDNLNVKNVTTDRVQVANGPSMSKDGINAAGKAISNVANGNVAADSKDAVNGGQLHETAKSVADVIGGGATVKDGKVVAGQNGIGNTGQNTVHGAIAAINQNTANNFNQIRGDLRKMDRDLRGGIAGALATAGLPQAFRPGKSMVAAAASTYRGQSGLAIGVSRISDNGKVILKVTGNTNSRGDFGGTIGAGYQW